MQPVRFGLMNTVRPGTKPEEKDYFERLMAPIVPVFSDEFEVRWSAEPVKKIYTAYQADVYHKGAPLGSVYQVNGLEPAMKEKLLAGIFLLIYDKLAEKFPQPKPTTPNLPLFDPKRLPRA